MGYAHADARRFPEAEALLGPPYHEMWRLLRNFTSGAGRSRGRIVVDTSYGW